MYKLYSMNSMVYSYLYFCTSYNKINLVIQLYNMQLP